MLEKNYVNFIWSFADLLRGSYKPHQYESIVLLFTILRRVQRLLPCLIHKLAQPLDD